MKINFQQVKEAELDATWNTDQSLKRDKLKTQTQAIRLQINENAMRTCTLNSTCEYQEETCAHIVYLVGYYATLYQLNCYVELNERQE
jgi:hypothetical protein